MDALRVIARRNDEAIQITNFDSVDCFTSFAMTISDNQRAAPIGTARILLPFVGLPLLLFPLRGSHAAGGFEGAQEMSFV